MAAKEVRATLVSVRLGLIGAVLALALFSGAYATAPGVTVGAQPDLLAYDFINYPSLNTSAPEIALFIAHPTGQPSSGTEVWLINASEGFGGPAEVPEVIEIQRTDGSGWVRFEDLASRYQDRELAVVLADKTERRYAFLSTYNLENGGPIENASYLRIERFSFERSQSRQIVSLVFVDTKGVPLENASVYIFRTERVGPGTSPPPDFVPPGGWGPYWNGTTDANGFYLRSDPLTSGFYIVRAAAGDLNASDSFGFYAAPNPLDYGPDGVLAYVGLAFLPYLLPLLALVIGYDAIARERVEGSLDMLLSKPVTRLGVALGKLSGAFAGMAVPIVAILIFTAGIVWWRSGQAPTVSFLLSLIGAACFLLLMYALLFISASSLVRNVGTGLLVSVLVYLLFAFFWGLASLLLANALSPPGSLSWFGIVVAMSVSTPTGIYQQVLAHSLPNLFGGFFGLVGGTLGEVPISWIAFAGALWIVVPLSVFLWTMKYTVAEG